MKLGILEPDHFSLKAIECLSKEFEVEKFEYNSDDEASVKEALKGFIEDKDAIFIRLAYEINDELLERAKKLRFICSPTTGLNHITTTKASMNQHGENAPITIVCLKGEAEFLSTIRATPEHTFGLAMGLLRNYSGAMKSLSNDEWNRDLYRGEEMFLNSVGIIGFGRVGRIIAGYYQAFGSEVSYYDIQEIEKVPEGVTCEASLEDLIQNNNIIHMCASYSDEYREYFDKKYFSMLDGKYFINTARGELLQEDDLIQYVNTGAYKGIAIDVLSGEAEAGFEEKYNLLLAAADGKNVIITPHISGATFSSMARTEEFIVDKLLKLI